MEARSALRVKEHHRRTWSNFSGNRSRTAIEGDVTELARSIIGDVESSLGV